MLGIVQGVQECPLSGIGRSRGEAGGRRGKRGGRHCSPPDPSVRQWWADSWWRGDSFKALEAWVPASWGSPRPQQGPASLGAPSLPAVAVLVRVSLGIRELLAAPTEILPLTANARRGCFHGNEREARPAGAGSLQARCWRPPLVPLSSGLWILGRGHAARPRSVEMALSIQGSWGEGSAVSESWVLSKIGLFIDV